GPVVRILSPPDRDRPDVGVPDGAVDPVHVVADLRVSAEWNEGPGPVLERGKFALVHLEENLRSAAGALDLQDLGPARIGPPERPQLAQNRQTCEERGHRPTISAGRLRDHGGDPAACWRKTDDRKPAPGLLQSAIARAGSLRAWTGAVTRLRLGRSGSQRGRPNRSGGSGTPPLFHDRRPAYSRDPGPGSSFWPRATETRSSSGASARGTTRRRPSMS